MLTHSFYTPAPVTRAALLGSCSRSASSSSYPQTKLVVLDNAEFRIQAAKHAIWDRQHPFTYTQLFKTLHFFSTTFECAVGCPEISDPRATVLGQSCRAAAASCLPWPRLAPSASCLYLHSQKSPVILKSYRL